MSGWPAIPRGAISVQGRGSNPATVGTLPFLERMGAAARAPKSQGAAVWAGGAVFEETQSFTPPVDVGGGGADFTFTMPKRGLWACTAEITWSWGASSDTASSFYGFSMSFSGDDVLFSDEIARQNWSEIRVAGVAAGPARTCTAFIEAAVIRVRAAGSSYYLSDIPTFSIDVKFTARRLLG